jgi:hypothetical protein
MKPNLESENKEALMLPQRLRKNKNITINGRHCFVLYSTGI